MGRMSEPPEIRAAIRAVLDASRAADRWPAAASWSPPAARGSRSTACASSATARRGGWAPRWRTRPPPAAPRSRRFWPTAASRPAGGEVVEVETTEELERETLARAAGADVVLMAAAVADYRPAAAASGKRPRGGSWTLELEPTATSPPRSARPAGRGQVLVGFAAEMGGDGVGRAREKLARKGLDVVVLNDVSRADIGFDAADNEVALVFADRVEPLPKAEKRAVAAAILDRVERLLS